MSDHTFHPDRRELLRFGGAAASLAALSRLGIGQPQGGPNRKTLVCVFLAGGNDGHNLIVPRSGPEYTAYAAARQNLAIPQGDLLPITAATPDGALYGLHPSVPELQGLFTAGKLAVALSQGGEFAFFLLGAALGVGVIGAGEVQLLVVVVAITMMATPFLDRLGRLLAERVERRTVVGVEQAPEQTDRLSNHVVIAGFGRVGAAVAARLRAEKVPFIAVDLDPHLIHQARRLGEPVYYGDVTRAEILDAVHIERARALVVAMNNPKAALQLVALMNYIFPNLPVYARARDDAHARELEKAGAHTVVPELVATGVKLASSIVEGALSEELFQDKPES